jgi:HSP20 family protein
MTSMNRWEPDTEFLTLREAMNRLFDDSVVGQSAAPRSNGSHAEIRLPIEAYATDHALVVRAPVPGVKPEDVEITIEGDTLTIRGEFEPPPQNVAYIFAERPWGRFSRTLQLNLPVEADKAEASFENGLLTLTLPKAEAVRPRVIPVKAK